MLELRVISGIDRLINSRIIRHLMSDDDLKLAKAQKDFWQQADSNQLAILLGLFNKE